MLSEWDTIHQEITTLSNLYELDISGYQQNSIIILLYFYKYKIEQVHLPTLKKLLPWESAFVLLKNPKIQEVLEQLKNNGVMEVGN